MRFRGTFRHCSALEITAKADRSGDRQLRPCIALKPDLVVPIVQLVFGAIRLAHLPWQYTARWQCADREYR